MRSPKFSQRLVLAGVLAAFPLLLRAEDVEKPFTYNGNGIAVESCVCLEGLVWRGVTSGGEVGYWRFIGPGEPGFGVFTLNAGYHFVDRRKFKRFDPFVNAAVLGLGVSSRGGVGSYGGVGGGLNYWFKPQFEVGRGQVGKGGIVRDPELHRAA
ncbi:MAG: hypothetical protein M1541_18490, partial [Acidobacteria bacterium]|nr:hypothetical protein [Acidobacteriota bacterium]